MDRNIPRLNRYFKQFFFFIMDNGYSFNTRNVDYIGKKYQNFEERDIICVLHNMFFNSS